MSVQNEVTNILSFIRIVSHKVTVTIFFQYDLSSLYIEIMQITTLTSQCYVVVTPYSPIIYDEYKGINWFLINVGFLIFVLFFI